MHVVVFGKRVEGLGWSGGDELAPTALGQLRGVAPGRTGRRGRH